MNYREDQDLAVKAAKSAGELLKRFDRSQIDSDEKRDIKHRADKASNSIVTEILQQGTSYDILSEEDFRNTNIKTAESIWIVDPLDGTLNYTRDLGMCCVSIALWRYGQPVLGVVYDFERDCLFTGIAGEGCRLNGNSILPSFQNNPQKTVLATGFPVNRNFEHHSLKDFLASIVQFKKIRLLGSAALSMAYVASGRVDAYFEEDIMIWDVAAGIALVQAAGGFVRYDWSIYKPLALTVRAGDVFKTDKEPNNDSV